MKHFFAYITQLDQKAVRAVMTMVMMVAFVAVLLIVGRDYIAVMDSDVRQGLASVRGTVWALPVTIAIFTCAAFIGLPQWAMITGCVLAFGPFTGAIYAWVATLVSASVDFALARWLGAETVARYGGAFVNRIVSLVRRNGFFTSFAVRLVPTGPFILVNLAAGISRMTFPAFAVGTALGIIPKIVVIASMGNGVIGALEGRNMVFMAISIGLVIFAFFLMIVSRRYLQARLKEHEPDNPSNMS